MGFMTYMSFLDTKKTANSSPKKKGRKDEK